MPDAKVQARFTIVRQSLPNTAVLSPAKLSFQLCALLIALMSASRSIAVLMSVTVSGSASSMYCASPIKSFCASSLGTNPKVETNSSASSAEAMLFCVRNVTFSEDSPALFSSTYSATERMMEFAMAPSSVPDIAASASRCASEMAPAVNSFSAYVEPETVRRLEILLRKSPNAVASTVEPVTASAI